MRAADDAGGKDLVAKRLLDQIGGADVLDVGDDALFAHQTEDSRGPARRFRPIGVADFLARLEQWIQRERAVGMRRVIYASDDESRCVQREILGRVDNIRTT